MPKYLAAIEVDQRQRVITSSDKLKEMLGSSWTIEDTVDAAEDAAKPEKVQVVMPVSGAVWLAAEDKEALLRALSHIRRELVESRDLPCTFAWVDYARDDEFDDATRRLRVEVRKRKDDKTGASGEPAFPHLARCLIQPHTSANIWRPERETDPQHRRRALVSNSSNQRFQKVGKSLGRYRGRPDLEAPNDFEDLLPEQSANQYIALVKADGDGLGTLIANLSWEKLGAQLGTTPPEAMRRFSLALERCLSHSVNRAVNAALEGIVSGRRPVAPIVAAGEDIAILCRLDLAFRLAVDLSKTFEELTRADQSLKTACNLTEPAPALTLSCGVLYARQGYPFDILWDLAGELESLAKEYRKDPPKKNAGCIDYYWLDSTGRPKIDSERRAANHISDGESHFFLYSRPWTIEEAECVLAALPDLKRISWRKWPQLDTALRMGASLSELAYRRWLTHLDRGEQKAYLNAIERLPVRIRPDISSPWVKGRTCLLELYELMEAHADQRV